MESRQIRESRMAKNGRSLPFHIFPAVFLAVPPLFSPVFHDFGQKRQKRVPKNGGTGKEKMRSFPVSFPFPFFYRSLPGTTLLVLCFCFVCTNWFYVLQIYHT